MNDGSRQIGDLNSSKNVANSHINIYCIADWQVFLA